MGGEDAYYFRYLLVKNRMSPAIALKASKPKPVPKIIPRTKPIRIAMLLLLQS